MERGKKKKKKRYGEKKESEEGSNFSSGISTTVFERIGW